jgi:hypothetical protein
MKTFSIGILALLFVLATSSLAQNAPGGAHPAAGYAHPAAGDPHPAKSDPHPAASGELHPAFPGHSADSDSTDNATVTPIIAAAPPIVAATVPVDNFVVPIFVETPSSSTSTASDTNSSSE